jgi:hypothetical protein
LRRDSAATNVDAESVYENDSVTSASSPHLVADGHAEDGSSDSNASSASMGIAHANLSLLIQQTEKVYSTTEASLNVENVVVAITIAEVTTETSLLCVTDQGRPSSLETTVDIQKEASEQSVGADSDQSTPRSIFAVADKESGPSSSSSPGKPNDGVQVNRHRSDATKRRLPMATKRATSNAHHNVWDERHGTLSSLRETDHDGALSQPEVDENESKDPLPGELPKDYLARIRHFMSRSEFGRILGTG